MSSKHFMIWNFISIYQASAIIITSFLAFDDYLNSFVGITFSALILIETFNIIILVPRFSKWMTLSILSTFVFYFLCSIIVKS